MTDVPPNSQSKANPADLHRMDLRDLEPPEPMVRVMTALDALPPGESLEAILPRKPVYILPQLVEEGHTYTLEPGEGDSWVLRLTKA